MKKNVKNFVSNIKVESNKLISLSNEELDLKIEKIKKRSQKESLNNLSCEWFAIVQEVAYRTIGLRHFDTQLAAGLLLHEGKIVEMKTGEGKTLASTLPIALNALSQKGVHVVTVNEYLAERDQKWMGKVYNALDLTVGLVKNTSTKDEKKKSYLEDITYVTNSELVFDFLRDNSVENVADIVQRPFHYCLIDEIDSILIDEARTPLILSGSAGTANINKLSVAESVAALLQKDLHFQVDEKRRDINLTESGYSQAIKNLNTESLYDWKEPWILEILNALKANHIFKKEKDYIISSENKVVIVDEFTGRVMEDRRWSLGIHEAIEMKEKVEIGGATTTKSSITYQNFFPLYPKLAGMTGTAKTAEKEFQDIYNLEVIVLPTAKPMIRKDLPDLVYQTELAKWKAVLNKAEECFVTGQPLLIGTANVEKSEFLSKLFDASNIPHQVLNAKPENISRESEIVAQAGERYAITIATNMAGRGTDIILGGNPVFQVKQKLLEILIEKNEIESKKYREENKITQNLIANVYNEYENEIILDNDIHNLPYSLEASGIYFQKLYNYLYKEFYSNWEQENSKVKNLGGLFVLGTERHETRRIDNQLRGRAGRQGDPGSSQFFVCLEDDVIKIFGGDNIRRWVEYLVDDPLVPLESGLLTKSLENAQKKIELYNYDIRKNVFQYDEILNNQRKEILQVRNQLLLVNNYNELILLISELFFDKKIKNIEKYIKLKFIGNLEKWFGTYCSFLVQKKQIESENFYQEIWISEDLQYKESNFYELGLFENTRSTLILSFLDDFWTQHLERMDYIRETVNWRSYGQQNPLIEYNFEARDSYKQMLKQIGVSMLYYFISIGIIRKK